MKDTEQLGRKGENDTLINVVTTLLNNGLSTTTNQLNDSLPVSKKSIFNALKKLKGLHVVETSNVKGKESVHSLKQTPEALFRVCELYGSRNYDLPQSICAYGSHILKNDSELGEKFQQTLKLFKEEFSYIETELKQIWGAEIIKGVNKDSMDDRIVMGAVRLISAKAFLRDLKPNKRAVGKITTSQSSSRLNESSL